MAGGLFVLILIAVLAGVGRFSVPPRERVALRRWTLRDLGANVLRGITVLGEHGPALPVGRRPERVPDEQPR
ncbi:hypothetical protein ACH9EU_16225 [Kocuria sp. M1R5S2]|uniref:hypothetical protein n=1 Tax=Kocuria rhizosphaerae TaxID=3376285 RepID=UPI00379C7B43